MLYVYLEHVEEKQEEATFHYLIADNILTELLESREIQCMTSIYKDSLCMIATGNMEAEDLSNEMNENQEIAGSLKKETEIFVKL